MGHLKAHDEILHRPVVAAELPQILIIIGIRQKAHVKYQIGIRGDSIFKSKGKDGNHQIFKILVLYKNLVQLLLQLPGEQIAGINDVICLLFQKFQALPLLLDAIGHPAVLGQRMTAAAFLIALHQHLVGRVQKQNLVIQTRHGQLLQLGRQLVKGLSASDIDAEGRLGDLRIARINQFGKFLNQ